MEFGYTTDNASTGAVAQYNGNISQIRWKTVGDAYTSIYGFEYDELNRLVKAKYSEQQGVTTNYGNLDRYNVDISYDLNGNIQTLDRKGFISMNTFGDIDQLSYTYKNNSNILESVSDAVTANTKGFQEINTHGADYVYDANGNMTSDYNKGITITYNHMNLPKKVQYATGQVIDWVYDAAGVKLYKKTNDGSGNFTEKHYVGGIEYAGTATNNIDVEAIYHSEGRLTPNGSGYRYEYTLKDHLGNARVSFADIDNDGYVDQSEILQTNHYYPFGMRHEGRDLPQQGVTNAYQYNGKEFNLDFNLNWLDYDARWYDASLARWSAVDPLAEMYYSFSPYNYVRNNPIILIDPDGKSDVVAYALRKGDKFEGKDAQAVFASIQAANGGFQGRESEKENNGIFITYDVTRNSKDNTITVQQYKNTHDPCNHPDIYPKKAGKKITLTLGDNVKQEHVTGYSAILLAEILIESGNANAKITSGYRPASEQARVMYGNLVNKGTASQYKLYGPSGDKVIKVYESLKKKGKTKQEIITAMTAKINEVGPGNVSKHSSDPNVYNVLDIAPSSIDNRRAFIKAVKKRTGSGKQIKKYIPPPRDPAYHIEIPQPKSN